MRKGPTTCPRCQSPRINKKGYFVTKWNHQPVPRYRCKTCLRTFSTHTDRPTFGQHKPHLNQFIFQLYCSGTTQRRMARVLGINCKTVVRKFRFLALRARQFHQLWLGTSDGKSACAQFDEMESFEHTRLKPLTIPLAITPEGRIIDLQVASIPYKGKLAKTAYKKYGPRANCRRLAVMKVLESVRMACGSEVCLLTDAHSAYGGWIRGALPAGAHQAVGPVKGRYPPRRANLQVPLFRLNHLAAKIRHDLSRMGRKVWVTTKKAAWLQAHLDLYIAFNNGYPVGRF